MPSHQPQGFEWSVLSMLATSRHFLPESLSLELHYQTQFPSLPWYGRFRGAYEIGAWMDFMFSRGGYVLVDRRDNEYCAHCSEIVLARLACRECCGWHAHGAAEFESPSRNNSVG